MPEYAFTSDWVTHRIPHWQRLFADMAGQPDLRFLEVGSHEGRSALWWLENVLTHPTAMLVCVDPWARRAEYEQRFDQNILASGRAAQVRKLKGPSQTMLPRLESLGLEFDGVYVDGSHEGADVLLDALLAWRLLKPGGLLIFDDYEWTGDGRHHPPKPAIDAFLSLNDWRLEVLHTGYQVAVRKTG